jgi:hypothetical protein
VNPDTDAPDGCAVKPVTTSTEATVAAAHVATTTSPAGGCDRRRSDQAGQYTDENQ